MVWLVEIILLGEILNCQKFESRLYKAVDFVKMKCKVKINEDILKKILGSRKYDREGKTLDLQFCSEKHCYIAGVGYISKVESGILLIATDTGAYRDALEYLNKTLDKLDVNDNSNRKPIILVLDYEVQVNELFLCIFMVI